jgi:hypothetical protein
MDNNDLERDLLGHAQDLAKKAKREITLGDNDRSFILHCLQVLLRIKHQKYENKVFV